MKIAGIDLAAKEKNPTGIALMDGRRVKCLTLYTNLQIFSQIIEFQPSIVAIDAPLTLNVKRYADKYLRKYGAMSLKIPSMMELARRGLEVKEYLEGKGYKVIEVFPTATAKILGFYSKDKMDMLSYFQEFGIEGGKNKHEVDALIAAYTGWLYALDKYRKIDGVVIPEENL
ncbi:hypothetical protein B6U71_04870 [Euryarchaeota archaeon ex4484_178]|nr:MAG: hypothetical protein B6U71_04870 [Euryarchaeota archaeon ex4484_178]